MKVYCFFSVFLPNLGGVERYTYYLAKKLIERGDKVIVVTSNIKDLPEQGDFEGITVLRIPCFKVLGGRFPVLKPNAAFFRLFKTLKGYCIDFAIINTRFYIHSLFGVWFACRKRIKRIVIEHGTNHFTIENKCWDFFGHIYEHFITFMVKRFCADFYGVSNACNQWLKHFNINARSTINNAVDLDEIHRYLSESKIDYRSDLAIAPDDFVIAYTGRLIQEKGILKLIEAVSRINALNKHVFLIIAGDGKIEQTVKSLQTKNIILLGRIRFEEIISLLKAADAFCLPTDYPEGLPTSVLEAIACKCSVITTTAGGSKELIESEEYGIILQDNSVDEIVGALLRVIQDEEYRETITKNSYDRLIRHNTLNIALNQLINATERGNG